MGGLRKVSWGCSGNLSLETLRPPGLRVDMPKQNRLQGLQGPGFSASRFKGSHGGYLTPLDKDP